MSRYSKYSDDYYVNINLNTEMDLPDSRETVLHYFEQIQKRFPSMRNFYGRERDEFVLEAEKEHGSYRWTTVEPRRICGGSVNPDSVQEAMELHTCVVELAPYFLTLSPLDCESFNLMVGFDFTYRGNHNQLVADTLGLPLSFDRLLDLPGAKPVAYEPSIQFAFDDDCRVQCRLSVETRTAAYNLRTGEFPEEQLSVYVTARRYGSLDANESYVDVATHLSKIACEIIDDHVADNILQPLQQAIAIK